MFRFDATPKPSLLKFLNFRSPLDGQVETGVDRIIPPHQEGRFAIVTDVGTGCGGRFGDARRAAPEADGEVVWSWRPDAGAKFLRKLFRRSDGGKRARSPGRARYKLLKPLRAGMPGVSRWTRGD